IPFYFIAKYSIGNNPTPNPPHIGRGSKKLPSPFGDSAKLEGVGEVLKKLSPHGESAKLEGVGEDLKAPSPHGESAKLEGRGEDLKAPSPHGEGVGGEVIFSTQPFTWGLFVLLSIGIAVQGYRLSQKTDTLDSVNIDLKGYQKEVLTNGTLKFSTPTALVYVKPLAGFHSAEHSPLFCWQGSGYTFQHNKKITVNQQEIYIGKLTKEKDVLYTAWWFSNGKYHTLNPFVWRWQSLQGQKDFYLMNVSTSDEATLLIEVKKLIP
ncbi:MAG: hypothetical protein ACOVQA_04215, partial [Thermoflexibacteraceae bacterium]